MALNNWRLELEKQMEKWFVDSLTGFLADMAYGLAMGASLNWGLGKKQHEGRGKLEWENRWNSQTMETGDMMEEGCLLIQHKDWVSIIFVNFK